VASLAAPPESPADTASTTEESKQQLRVRRFLLASAFSVLYLAVLFAFQLLDKVDVATFVAACGMVAAMIVLFFGLFRLGLNLRFRDPSLTAWQFLAAVYTMLYVFYRAPDTRLAFSAFFFVALMFAMLRHNGRELALLGAVSLVSYAFVAWLRFALNGDREALDLDALQFAVMTVTSPWLLFIGGRVNRLRRGLTEASVKLEDIEEKARRDELTGVYNRRALLVAMEESKRRADQTGEPLSICVIDLDFFKRYNDEFDHLTGDQVLRLFARAVQDGLRATDIFGRYGGEEFVQILRNTTLAGAIADAERLRERIGTIELPIARSLGRVTVSIGVAQYVPGETMVQTFARADEAMYEAKRHGRNRVESSPSMRSTAGH
jgi:diguanylate cyclase